VPRRILLADDSVTAQNMGRRILSEAGYEVSTVNNGPAALKKIAEQKPDLIILDIYMPGYGGIEVCQKIKEDAQTSSIPVLLTVGKLEPFKADEARKVHADAHLVKPFEATELLAALTRLEDKIVPQGIAPQGDVRAGKPAKGKGGAGNGKDKKFGDADSGWKQRLGIPVAEAKRSEPKEKPAKKEAPSKAFRDFARPEASSEETVAVGPTDSLPADITAEEIAAITSAAAAFDQEKPANEFASATELEQWQPRVEAQALVATTPASHEVEPAMPPPPSPLPPELESLAAAIDEHEELHAALEQHRKSQVQERAESTEPQAVTAEASPPAREGEVVASSGEAAEPVAEEQQPESPSDEEVAAALESLTPMSTEAFSAATQYAETAVEHEYIGDGVDRVGNWGNESPVFARWVAQEVAVSEAEAALILEEEMQTASAALAEVESPGAEPLEAHAEVAVAVEQSSISQFVPAEAPGESSEEQAAAPESLEVASAPVEELSRTGTEPQEAEAGEAASAEIAPAETLEEAAAPEMAAAAEPEPELPSEQTAEIQPAAMEPELIEVVARTEAEALPDAESVAEEPAAIAAEAANVSTEEAAYAAAAAVSADFRNFSQMEAAQVSALPDSQGAQPEAGAISSEKEADLAAAWAQWRQIRESIATPQFTEQVAEVAAAGYKEIHKPETAPTPQSEKSSAAEPTLAADPSAIASIVESVLAELKPKLVEEIAKKLRKDK